MSYTAPPTFSDGNLLSASQLNALADDITFLAGIAGGVNIPFLSEETGAGSGFSNVYKIRHLHRYLHYKIRQTASTSDSLEIRYNGDTVYSDGGDRAAPYEWSDSIDLDDTGIITGLTYGNWYEVKAIISQKTGSGVSVLDYLLESDSATL